MNLKRGEEEINAKKIELANKKAEFDLVGRRIDQLRSKINKKMESEKSKRTDKDLAGT